MVKEGETQSDNMKKIGFKTSNQMKNANRNALIVDWEVAAIIAGRDQG